MLQLKKSITLGSLNLPFRDALQLAAELGAEGVEINARTEVRPRELSRTGVRQIKKWLSDYNLVVSMVQYPTRRGFDDPEDLEQRIEGTKAAMKMAGELGCSFISNRLASLPTADQPDRQQTLEAALHDISNFSMRSGAWLAIRTGGQTGSELAQLLETMPDGGLFIDFDPAELLMHRNPPGDTLRAIGEAVRHFRARDAVRDLSGGPTTEVQLGRGSIDFPELLGMLEEHHYSGFITVDRSAPLNPIIECGQAIEYLDNLFA